MKGAIKLRRGQDGEVTVLNASAMLGVGGEATVYNFPHDESLAAKVYLNPTEDHARKLAVMCAHPPAEGFSEGEDSPLAWPVDVLRSADRKKRVIGYLMPKMNGMAPIIDVYSLQARLKNRPQFTYQHLLRTGQNVAKAVGAVHSSNYVIGDLNYTNVFVSDEGEVTIIDTDSFQVADPDSGEIHRCPVFTPDFTPPELQGDEDTLVDRTIEQDLFGLGVLLFLLLMAGGHPYSGNFQEEGDPPPIGDRIKDGHYPYSVRRQVPYIPTAVALPIGILSPGLQKMFLQCFEEGHDNPSVRPSAKDWQAALAQAEQELVECTVNAQHKYDGQLASCPWCERTTLLGGRDPFPSMEVVDTGEHIQPMVVRQTLPTDWKPEWSGQQQTRQYKPAGRGLTPDSKFWVGLAIVLWVGIPIWSVAAAISASFVILAMFIYGMSAFMVPRALLSSVGLKRTLKFDKESRWMSLCGAGSVIGGVIIVLVSILSLA